MDELFEQKKDITNVISLYEPLAEVHKQLEYKNNDEASGFLKCLYLIKRTIKQYRHLNLHVENHKLIREYENLKYTNENQRNELAKWALRLIHLNGEVKELKSKIKQLESENKQLRLNLKRYKQ